MNLGKIAKALVAALGAAFLAFQTATGVESPGADVVTVNEWVGIAFALLIMGFTVWAVPNSDDKASTAP